VLKRSFWLVVGAGFGFGMSFWTLRAVRRTADRYLPPGLVERVERALDALDGGTSSRNGNGILDTGSGDGRRTGGSSFVDGESLDRRRVGGERVDVERVDTDRAARSALRARVSGHPAAAGLRALAGGIGTSLPVARNGILSELDRGVRE
jgi:hypothetical protein